MSFFFVYLAIMTKIDFGSIIIAFKKKRIGVVMIVCAHGEVSEYCKNRDMIIVERYDGDIENVYNFVEGQCFCKAYS